MSPGQRTPPAQAVVGDLPDLNVWLALAIAEHPHHRIAQQYWQDAGRVLFCRVTMLGLVRLLTQRKLMGAAALSLREALSLYKRFAALPEVDFCAEPAGCEDQLSRRVTRDTPARLWTDIYLAGFATSAGLRLVTFDKDFDRFPELICLRLAAA